MAVVKVFPARSLKQLTLHSRQTPSHPVISSPISIYIPSPFTPKSAHHQSHKVTNPNSRFVATHISLLLHFAIPNHKPQTTLLLLSQFTDNRQTKISKCLGQCTKQAKLYCSLSHSDTHSSYLLRHTVANRCATQTVGTRCATQRVGIRCATQRVGTRCATQGVGTRCATQSRYSLCHTE